MSIEANIETNKAVVHRFCELLTAGKTPAVLDLMTDDVNYWILGDRTIIPSAGDHSKAAMKRIFDAMEERMVGPLTFTPKSLIAEGDQVALEAQSHGQLKNGRVYANRYHLRITLRDGKIAAIREYLDTQHVYATWYAPEPSNVVSATGT
jgi:ketosteroid isomerase-like protein